MDQYLVDSEDNGTDNDADRPILTDKPIVTVRPIVTDRPIVADSENHKNVILPTIAYVNVMLSNNTIF